jgi:hypothetical protein
MGDVKSVTSEIDYKIGRGEVKYEVFQILEEAKEKADPKIKELALSIIQAVEQEVQKL